MSDKEASGFAMVAENNSYKYWDFLNSNVDITSQKGLEQLEIFFRKRSSKMFWEHVEQFNQNTVYEATKKQIKEKESISANKKVLTENNNDKSKLSDESNSDDDIFYTPKEYATPNGKYQCFIYGEKPTKRDLEVLYLLTDIEIDEDKYPHIYMWHKTLMDFTSTERNLFPTPAVFGKSIENLTPIMPINNSNSMFLSGKRLFNTPHESFNEWNNHSATLTNQLSTSITFTDDSNQKGEVSSDITLTPITPNVTADKSMETSVKQLTLNYSPTMSVAEEFSLPKHDVVQSPEGEVCGRCSSAMPVKEKCLLLKHDGAQSQLYKTPEGKKRGLYSTYRQNVNSSSSSCESTYSKNDMDNALN